MSIFKEIVLPTLKNMIPEENHLDLSNDIIEKQSQISKVPRVGYQSEKTLSDHYKHSVEDIKAITNGHLKKLANSIFRHITTKTMNLV